MTRSRLAPWLIAGALGCLLPLRLSAQVSTQRGASIIVFPKVIADGTSDTMIQITNLSGNIRTAQCFYINAGLTDPNAPPGADNPPLWTEIDFDIWLTANQPTHWVVSRGRLDNAMDDSCGPAQFDCDGAGYDPGRVPPVSAGFRGEAFCVEEDASGFPVPGNALIGKATLTNRQTGDIDTYSAIGLHGFDTNNLDGVLCLGGGVSASCPNGAEYAACPETWILDHLTDGSRDPIDGGTSSVSTNLTVVPCRQNLKTQVPSSVTLQFLITNAFEEIFSASTMITCWSDIPLSSIGTVFQGAHLGSAYAQTRIRSVVPTSETPVPGFLITAQTFRVANGLTTSTATTLHSTGTQADTDVIVIPVE